MMFALVGVLLLAVGCRKEVKVAFTTSTVNVAAEGGEALASLTSNGDWVVDSHPEWLTVSPMNGFGDAQFKLTVSANDAEETRSGEVKVSSKDHTATLTVTQEFVEKYLRVTNGIYADCFGGSFTIDVESNVEWTISGMPVWISTSVTEGSNNGEIGVEIASIQGEVSEGRQAVLTIEGGGKKALCVVSQSHETQHVFSIDPMDFAFSCEGGTTSLTVRSTMPWAATSQTDWFTFSPGSGEGNAEMTVDVSENSELFSREGNIQFSCTYPDGTTGTAMVWVRQEAAPDPHFLTVDPAELTLGNEGGTTEVKVECDTDWNVIDFQSAWATVSAMSGTGNGIIAVSADPNPINEPRSFSFTVVSGELVKRVTVSQEAGEEPPFVSLTPDTLSVPYSGSVSNNLTLASNVPWTLLSSDSWILLSSSSGEGNATVGVVVDMNLAETPRYGSVKAFYNGQLMDETFIVQEGKPNFLETDITEINAGPEGGEYIIQVTANQSWTVEKGAAWMTIDPQSGTGDGQIVVKIKAMLSMLPRTAEIHIIGSLGSTVIIPVTQSH